MHNTLALPTRKKEKLSLLVFLAFVIILEEKKDAKEFYRLAKSFQSIKLTPLIIILHKI